MNDKTEAGQDIILEEWEAWCESHINEPHCPCQKCNYVHPGNLLKFILEVKQLTCIALFSQKECVGLKERINNLENEKKNLLEKVKILEDGQKVQTIK